MPHTAIVLVNYRNWQDTIECLESLYRNSYPEFQVIVCDNNSGNRSLEKIAEWAEGKIPAPLSSGMMERYSVPPVPKPIPYVIFDSPESAETRWEESETLAMKKKAVNTKYPLVLLQTGKNAGFSSGNNAGIRYALCKPGCEFVWCLNNDTVIEKDALSKLAEYYHENRTLRGKKTGLIATKLRSYEQPDGVFSVGGKYVPWLGRLKGDSFDTDLGQYDRPIRIKSVAGASMAASAEFIRDAGMLDESYFLFFEEFDWSLRAIRKGYALGYQWKSIVYHKGGMSIGEGSKEPSPFSVYHNTRSKLIYTRKHYPVFYPQIALLTWASGMWKKLRGRMELGGAILKALYGKPF